MRPESRRRSSRAAIDDFLAQRTLAFIGVSRTESQFGNSAFRALRAAGYTVLPVHPELTARDGVPCARRLEDVASSVGGLVVMAAPQRAEEIAREAAAAGIARVWFQQNASSEAALTVCDELGVRAVHGECLLMFLPNTGLPHRVHRWLAGAFGKLPR